MLSNKLFLSLYIIALLAFTFVSAYNQIFEIFLLLLVFLHSTTLNKKIIPILSITLVYLVVSCIYAVVINKAYILDFLLVYKFFIYIIFIAFLAGKKVIEQNQFSNFYKFLLWVFFLKYTFSVFILNNPRPVLFYENNYELMFLSLLFYLNYVIRNKAAYLDQFILSLIFIMSGSKSALLILIFVLAVVNYQFLYKKAHFIIPGIIGLSFITLGIFKQRMGGEFNIENIDRFKFLMVFFGEVEEWSIMDFILGADRITPLSSFACGKLGYFQSLFSYSGDGSCYSVIFHSYILRVIYDHGILGLIAMMYFVFRILKISNYRNKDAFVVITIGLINGLSVSSFNSIYFILGISIYLIVIRRQSTEPSNTYG